MRSVYYPRPTNWSAIYVVAAIIGVLIGYTITLLMQHNYLPPLVRFTGLTQPITILILGTDVDYTQGKRAIPLTHSFRGRSDTILVVHLDPIRNQLGILSIPRDTLTMIPGHGEQKINAANAYGGPLLAEQTVSNLLGIPIDYYLILNLQGFVKLINELGGITVEIPLRMHYIDWTAKLNIDLTPGYHTLTGNQAMGFVRFRHTALGDIGRVQRQQIFLKALLARALRPDSLTHIPALYGIVQEYTETNMSEPLLLSAASFAHGVPPENQCMVMLPGNFSADSAGNWIADTTQLSDVVSKLQGYNTPVPASLPSKTNTATSGMQISVENDSRIPKLGRTVAQYLQLLGYSIMHVTPGKGTYHAETRIIAQRANPEDAQKVKDDLKGTGQVISQSIGNIDSAITVMVGDDLLPMFNKCLNSASAPTRSGVRSTRPGGF